MAVTDDLPDGSLCLHRAAGFFERLLGLLGRSRLATNEAFLIERCRAIHTIGMRMTIDVVFLSERGVVVGTVGHVPPWRIASCGAARHVLELAEGQAGHLGLEPGTCVSIGATSLRIDLKNEVREK